MGQWATLTGRIIAENVTPEMLHDKAKLKRMRRDDEQSEI